MQNHDGVEKNAKYKLFSEEAVTGQGEGERWIQSEITLTGGEAVIENLLCRTAWPCSGGPILAVREPSFQK